MAAPLEEVPLNRKMSSMWLLTGIPAIMFVVAELWSVITGHTLGTFSNTNWWLENSRFSIPWFLVVFFWAGLGVWFLWHLGEVSPGPKQLIACLVGCEVLGLLIWSSYRW